MLKAMPGDRFFDMIEARLRQSAKVTNLICRACAK